MPAACLDPASMSPDRDGIRRAPRSARSGAPDETTAARPTACILVVEDDPDDRRLYGMTLKQHGYDVAYAGDYDSGLELARTIRPDLILLDLGLPGSKTGLELLLDARRHHATAHLPIIVLSGFAESHVGDAARLAGCTIYLEKPASPLAVVRQISELLDAPSDSRVE